VVCNDGTITFSVARAYRDLKFISGYEWQFEGWYNVDPGKCKEIGRSKEYSNGGMFRKDSVTLLAFAFYDSTGTWGAVKLRPVGDWQPSNQQFCVLPEGVAYDRDSPGGDLPRTCDGAQTGYQMIPASFEYGGPPGFIDSPWSNYDSKKNELHVKLGPSDRAIPIGKQPSSGGASQSSSSAGTGQNKGDAGPGLCGKVSCWDYFAQGVRQAEAQRAAANANHNPPPPSVAPRPVVSPAPAPAADDPIGQGGFITPPPAHPQDITPPPAHPQKLTARLFFGEAVHFDGSVWRFENGMALPTQLIDEAGRPPLLPKQQYSVKQAPVAGYVQTIKNVLASVQACKEYTGSTKTQLIHSVESSGFDLYDYGLIESNIIASPPSDEAKINHVQAAALANLDVQHAEFFDRGCLLLVIRCKNGSSCARSQVAQRGSSTDDRAQSFLTFRINTREQGAKILDALTAASPFYPAGDGETHEIP
jgi:hypothetical protein